MAIRSILHTLLGFAVPIETSSRLYLAQQLARRGVEYGRIPEACLQELADQTVSLARTVGAWKGENWRANVTDLLDGAAINIASLLQGTHRPDEVPEHQAKILRQHGVRTPYDED